MPSSSYRFLIIVSLIFNSSLAIAKMHFSHPGAWNSSADLAYAKKKIKQKTQPWFNEYQALKKSRYAQRQAHFLNTVNARDNKQAKALHDDVIAAYSQALLWYFSDEETYAQGALNILKAWTHFQGFNSGSDQDKLQAGWSGAIMASAAEILRLYPSWSTKQQHDLQLMFKHAFYPQLLTASNWNGNVDLSQLDAAISIAVFNEDDQLFKLALKRLAKRNPAYFYLKSDGPLPASIAGDGNKLKQFWFQPEQWPNGLTQETCRDNGHHSQFGLGSAIHVAEVAWNQGVDVYSLYQDRYVAATELLSKQLLTGKVTSCTNKTATTSRFNTFEIAYKHYHNRQGIKLPYTQQLLEKEIRSKSHKAVCNLVYETLGHAKHNNK